MAKHHKSLNMASAPKSPKLSVSMRMKLSIGSFLMQLCTRRDGSLNRGLYNFFFDWKTPPNITGTVGDVVVSSSDIIVDPTRGVWFRLFAPQTTSKLPLIVYFHGGGFSGLSPDIKMCDDFCRTLAGKVPAVIASVNYRLAPEHKYPCQYEDGYDTLRFIDEQNYAVLPGNTDLANCFLAGDSAGGNIAHHVTQMACQSSQPFNKLKFSGLVGIQPFFGGEERTESELRLAKGPVITTAGADKLWEMFLPEGADRNHPAANVFGGGGDGGKEVERVEFPKSLVIVGGFDPLQDWQKRYAEGLKKCGKEAELVQYPNAFHGFYSFQELPEFDLCVQDITRFIHCHSN